MGLGSGKNQAIKNYNHLVRCVSTNTGNLLFNFAIENLVKFTQSDIRWATPSEVINNENTPILLPMANNVGPHTDLNVSGPKLEGVKVHKTIMGLGAQFPVHITDAASAAAKVPEGTVQWLRQATLGSTVPNISVRGEFTKNVLTSLGFGDFAVPLGCPSHFINEKRNLGATLKQKTAKITPNLADGIAVAAGNTGIKNLNALERFFIELLNSYGGKYIVQHPKTLICLSQRWEHELDEEEIIDTNKNLFPRLARDEMLSWFSKFSFTYSSVPQWMLDISKHEIAIGTRIHGIQVALQSEVPAVCLYIDSRTKELCETMKIPCLSAHEFQKDPSVEQVLALLKDWNWSEYDENRTSLAKGTENFIKNNNLTLQRNRII